MMDALSTARRVLRWAADPVGSPPVGPLSDIQTLAQPDQDILDALRYLAGATAARLGAGAPPLGDPRPPGLGAMVLAAAVGGRTEPVAARVADVASACWLATGNWVDNVARHGLVAPTLAGTPAGGLSAELTQALLAASPLTMILHRPVASEAPMTRFAVPQLLGRPRGEAVLTSALAAPSAEPAVLTWRGELLDLLRDHHRALMLDVYLAARLWHGPAWDQQIQAARRELTDMGRASELTTATLRFWAPLAAVDRDEQEAQGLASRITRAEQPAGGGVRAIRDYVFLRREEYRPIVELITRYRPAQASWEEW